MHINSRRDKRNIKSKRIRNTVTIELSMYCSILQIKLLRVLAVHVHPFIEGKVVSHYGSIVLHYYHQAYFPFLTQIKCLYMCSLLWVFSKKCTEELRNKKCTHLSVDSSLFFWKTTLRLYNNMFNKMDSQWKGRIPKNDCNDGDDDDAMGEYISISLLMDYYYKPLWEQNGCYWFYYFSKTTTIFRCISSVMQCKMVNGNENNV